MKKFSKLFALIIAIATILTVFTIVSFADESKPELLPVVRYDKNFDSIELKTHQESNKGGYGTFIVDAQEGNDNHYVNYHHSGLESGGANSSYLSDLYSYGNTTTNLSDYPYAVFEFDIMKLSEDSPSFNLGSYIKNPKNSQVVYPAISSTEIYAHISDEVYEWSKVTLVYSYHSETVDGVTKGYAGYTLYVNGVKRGENLKNKSFTYDSEGLLNSYSESSLYFTDLRFDTPSYVSDSTDAIALDNVKMTLHPKSADINAVVAETYGENYKFPYTKTRAILNGVGYDDVQAAVDAANDGETVYLKDDVVSAVIVDKAITVEAGEFAFNFGSYKGFAAETSGTAYTFAPSDKTATVKFDVCEGECDCYFKNDVGHVLTSEALVALGQIPNTPTAEINSPENVKVIFKGWSYTKGSKTADTLKAITEEDIENGVTLYPVYEIIYYAFSVTYNYKTTYHEADEFVEAFASISSGATIKLLRNIEISSTITVSKSVTLDINGHDLTKVFYHGNHYVASYDEATDTYTYGTDTTYKPATAYNTSPTLFAIKSSVTFNLTSSVGGGNIYNANTKANTWYYGDKIVKRDILLNAVSYTIASSGSSFTVNVDGGINFYATALYYSASGAHAGTTINIDNINFYHMTAVEDPDVSGTSEIYYAHVFPINAKENEKMTVSNCVFYTPASATLIRCYNATTNNQTCLYKFINCDMIKSAASFRLDITSVKTASEIVLDNCRLYDAGHSSVPATSINGSYSLSNSDASSVPAGEGFTNTKLSTSKAFSYTVPNRTAFAVLDKNATIQELNLDYASTTKKITLYFNVVTTKEVKFNWVKDGEVYKTETVRPGVDTFEAPVIRIPLPNDPYRDMAYHWVDKHGVLYTDAFAWEDEYTFYATDKVDGKAAYVAGLKDAQLSFSYVTQFWQYVYLPVVEGMERPTLYHETGTHKPDNSSGTVLIGGQEYYFYTYWQTTVNSLNTFTITVNYTVDGVDYSAKIDTSALIYAEIILNNPEYYAAEQESVANLVRYVRNAYEEAGKTDSKVANNLALYLPRVEALIGSENADGSTTGGLYSLDKYTTDFGELVESKVDDYAKYIRMMSFGIASNTSARTIVVLTDEAEKAGVTVKINGSSARVNTVLIDGVTVNAYVADNQKVYDAAKLQTITLSIPAETNAETGETVPARVESFNYSIAHYVTAMSKQQPEVDISLAMALYEFGISAKAYRDNLANY